MDNPKQYSDEQLVTLAAETTGMHVSSRSLWAQAELTRRLMESIRNFDRSSASYSKRVTSLTFVMFFIAMLQTILVTFELPITEKEKVVMAIFVFVVIFSAAWYFAPFRSRGIFD